MFEGCHGADRLRTPELEVRKCPVCGGEIEIFSTDTEAVCENCGFVAYNNKLSCIAWCKYAKLCVGEEMYNKLKAALPTETKKEE